jgi:SpoVK/Ycf46/Vps4 family AAA+-type ATPase
MKRLDILLHLQVLKQQQASQPIEPFQGLVISEAEITSLFQNHRLAEAMFTESDNVYPNQALVDMLNQLDATIHQRRAASAAHGIALSLPTLSQLFRLNPFEERCLVICLAPEIGRRYEKVFAFLQDDITRKKPSIDLVLTLLCPTLTEKLAARSSFAPMSPLLYYRLLQITDSPVDNPVPLISRFLKLDDRIVEALIGANGLDARLSHVARFITDTDELDPMVELLQGGSRIQELINAYFRYPESAKSVVFYLYGRYGSGRQALAKWVCQQFRLPLLLADTKKLVDGPLPFAEMARLLCREAVLQPAALCFENFDALLGTDDASQLRLPVLCTELESWGGLTFLLGSQPWRPQALLKQSRFIEFACPVLDEITRQQFWTRQIERHHELLGEQGVAELASKFQLTPGQILDAIRNAENLAQWREPGSGRLTIEDLHVACQHQSSQELRSLAKKIEPLYGWHDIVLPDDQARQLREIASHVKYKQTVMGKWGFGKKFSLGFGVTALFAGPSGTGKTMAAEVIAKELSLELYKIDLSSVVSKYIGETEKNLQRIFTAASDSNAILFFDEADALFGKRSEVKDAHDRYANIEIAYLLQKMEEYSGIVIMATNLKKNMDEAFVRRIRFIIDFPLPDEKHREKIWLNMFPNQVPLSPNVNLSELAKKMKITGGSIKNISLRAAYLAAEDDEVIKMDDLILASKYELKKMGNLYVDADFKK